MDIAPGLWVWRLQHPAWSPEADWEPHVTSTVVETRGEVALIDPLAPPEEDGEVWERLDAAPPTLVVVLKPDHVRDVDLFVRRYGARAFGPSLFWRDDIPETELEAIEPGSELPGGLVALYDGRGRNETPLWAPERRALVFADALTERAASSGSGARPGTRSGRFPRSGLFSTFRSSTWSCRMASPCTTEPLSSGRSSSRPSTDKRRAGSAC